MARDFTHIFFFILLKCLKRIGSVLSSLIRNQNNSNKVVFGATCKRKDTKKEFSVIVKLLRDQASLKFV